MDDRTEGRSPSEESELETAMILQDERAMKALRQVASGDPKRSYSLSEVDA